MLSTSLVQANLKRIGRHPITLQHVLLELALSNKNLENINSISTFPHVMYLDLSTNNIETISILSELPTLVELNASRNKITECLDFGAPLCSFEQSWETGHNAAGSLLTNVDLSENSIQRLRDLSHHQFLEKLILHHNGISAIDGLHGLKYLRVLDLSYNNISVIEGLDNLPITELRLKGNKIQQLNGLDKLPHLSVLDVSENKIISLSQLALCTNLVHLDVSHNRIEYIRQCEYLQQVQWLTTLVLDNNPCERKELYRLRVLFRLPNLLMLDNSEASLEDKVRAFNLYHSPEGDLALREDVLRQYLPQVGFVDHSPQQLPQDEEALLSVEELLRGLPVDEMPVPEVEPAEMQLVVGEYHHDVVNLAILEEDEESQTTTHSPRGNDINKQELELGNGEFEAMEELDRSVSFMASQEPSEYLVEA